MVGRMYTGDSFFTLGAMAQVGLVLVSFVFAAVALALTRVLVWRRPVILRPAIWAVMFISFVWLSPEGYYTYYRLVIDGLPEQSVIKDPPPPGELIGLMTFTGPATLSAHATGVLGWLMLAAARWPQRRNCRDAAD